MDEKILCELNETQWSIEALTDLTRFIRLSGDDNTALRCGNLMLVIEHSLNDISAKLDKVTNFFDKRTLVNLETE